MSARPGVSRAGGGACAGLSVRHKPGAMMLRSALRPDRSGGSFPGNRGPLTHAPPGHEAIQDVGIGLRKFLRHTRGSSLEEEYCAVDRIRKRTAEYQLAGGTRCPCLAQMSFAEPCAPLQVIRAHIIEKEEVLHSEGSCKERISSQ